ncbi:ATP-binding protein [Mycobacterium conspicuum]|uniref:ATP-binding protein n=1 Tax=Mycobacterium conspicuum TaxID=44010 RepID=UPI001E53F93E|nr:adenylate/guanylate cyclase domain-containing protein [Mycobacterium conspicuum]
MGVSAAAAPSGVVTFLFTDIEGSTRRWEADAEGMRAALAAHDTVLREAINAQGGWLFKHTGDGVCAAFASPSGAVDAAVAAQRALELPVRMGIATGEAELRDGDYFGAVLNRAARVMAAGHGGQILLAESTAGLLGGVDLVDLGPRRLRDLPTAIGLFQVRAAGLPADFPGLRTLDTTPGNLRPPTTSFIGRESEVADLQSALKANRLVTLTGVGGVGKTRLALEVAARLAGEFPDGVWFLDLAAVTDPAAVPDAVAAALGIVQQPGKTVEESVASALEDRVRLLVFDNCEHVVDSAADLVEAILAASATVTILATSREGLGSGDEKLWRVPSLDVNSGTESAGVHLFLDRAQSVVSDFSLLQPLEAEAVIDICRKLDGIPLAIELAASRMASMTAGEVRDRLDQRFRLLVGSRRGLSRHQTLRHAVAWSYELLGEAERTLLARCSVFAGGFDLQSACAISGLSESQDVDDYAILDLLDALVRKSLLIVNRSTGRTRYSMLETIRQFAEDQLVACGEAETTRRAHARYFVGRAADIMTVWDSPRPVDAYAWFTAELANLRTAYRWAADQADLDVAATIAIYGSMLGVQSEKYEPLTWAEGLIEPARAVRHPKLAALYVYAALCYVLGRVEDAVQYADAGRPVIESGEFDDLRYGEEGILAGAYSVIGQPERAVEWGSAQLARNRDTYGITAANLVLALVWAGRTDEAMALAHNLVDSPEATRNPWCHSYALFSYGYAFSEVDPIRALEALRRGMAIAQASGSRYNISVLAAVLARLEAKHGDPLAALEYITVTIRTVHDSGNTATLGTALAVLATHFDRLGRYAPAATIAGFGVNPLNIAGLPELNTAVAHLREVLGEPAYESLARKGGAMTAPAIAVYALDQIDQASAELKAATR